MKVGFTGIRWVFNNGIKVGFTGTPEPTEEIITMTKSYLSGRQCCDFTIAEDDSETHEKGCSWWLVDEFAKEVFKQYGKNIDSHQVLWHWTLCRIEKLQEDMANSPIRYPEDAPGGPKIEHRCGVQGFDCMKDICPACVRDVLNHIKGDET